MTAMDTSRMGRRPNRSDSDPISGGEAELHDRVGRREDAAPKRCVGDVMPRTSAMRSGMTGRISPIPMASSVTVIMMKTTGSRMGPRGDVRRLSI
jgi:hypothetical protein